MLAARTRAVLARSSGAYLATDDTSAAARAFRQRQAAEITNLAGVPLASWSLRLDGLVHDPAAVRAQQRTYGAPAVIAQVSLSYALQFVDDRPTTHTLWLTFVRRDGHTLVAGDDALTADGSVSWRGPWDFGPVQTARGTHTLVLGPPSAGSALLKLAGIVDAAVPAVTAVWGGGWSQRVAVIVPSSTAEFDALTGTGSTVSDLSAVAVTDGIDTVSQQPYGQRLVLAPAALAHLSTVGEGIVLRHEITHLATAADTSATTPRWLVEGFADYVANLTSGQRVGTAASELRTAVRAGSVPAALPGEADFARTGVALARAYEQSWLACRLIAARAGQDGLVRFYRSVGTSDAPADRAVATAVRDVLHESVSAFTAQWRHYLRAELS